MSRTCPPLIAFLCVLTLAINAMGQTATSTVSLSNQDVRTAYIVAGSGLQSVPFVADPQTSGGDIVDVMVSDANVGVSLLLPDGREINQNNALSYGFGYEIIDGTEFHDGSITLPFPACGVHILIKFPAGSVPGTYQINLDGTNVISDAVAAITYFSSSTVRITLTTGSSSYHPGDTVVLNAVLLDGSSPIPGATVTAGVNDPAQPDVEPQQITLEDGGPFDATAGDGVYTGTLILNHAGQFTAAVRATGLSASGVNFSRVASATVKVENPLASFVSFQDTAVNNANGFIDRINLTANLIVQTAGNYRFTATLAAANGHEITNSAEGHLDVGNQQLSIPFFADSVFSLGIDGPYQIKNAQLIFTDDQNNPVADLRADAGTTAAYQLSSLNTSNGAADLSLTNVGDPSPVQVGQQISYSLTVYNIGTATATNVTLIEQLPANIVLNLITPAQGTCDGTGPVTCVLGDIGSNDSVNVEITVTTTAVGALTNNASVTTSARDFNASNNLATSVIRVSPQASVQFIGIDATTQGNWKGHYGSEGYNIVNDRESYPSYAVVQPSGQSVTTYEDPSNDIRALQKSSNTDRLAAAWYFYSMSIDLDFTDGQTHRVALYVLDWDNNGRYQQIDILDPATGQVLDSREISDYGHGKYLVWNLNGSVTIQIANSGPVNALVSGVFFDAGSTPLPLPPTYTISGTITDSGGTLLSNVPVAITGAPGSFNGSTGSDGHYSIPNVIGGADYLITPSGVNAPFTPASRTIKYLATNSTGDFIGTAALGGGRIAFAAGRASSVQISVMNEDGSGRRNIENDFYNEYSPAWSPDGNRIAFVKDVYAGGNYRPKLFVMNSDGSDKMQLTDGLRAGRPAWSPDGSKIAFADLTENGLEIFVMNPDGSDQTALTSVNNNYAPAWSPDGSKIAFVAERDFDREIYVMNADGSNQTRITFSPQDDLNPAWSPDGTRIAFDSFRDFNREIYLMNADGSGQVNLTNDPGIDSEPAWSPSGAKIAFSSFRSGNGGIYVMNADGSNPVALTDTGDEWPAWTASVGPAPSPSPSPSPSPTPKATTSTTLVSSLNPSVAGQSVTFTANVTGSAAPTGEVQFFDGPSVIATVALVDSSAAFSTPLLAPGAHSITAVYSGDANSESSTSQALNQIVYPVLSSLTLTPKSVAGSNSSIGTISLTGPAPPGGIGVALTSDNSAAALPQNVAIGGGADTATFTVTTTEVTASTPVHLTATWIGTTKKVTLTVLPLALKSVTVTPATVNGGASATSKVTLNGTAPAGGKLVTLASDNSVAAVPDNVTIPEGSSSATFAITTTPVESDTLTNLSATFNGVTKTDTLTVKEPIVKSVKLSPASVTGGASSNGTITLSGPAPSGGTTISLASNNAAASLPANLVVAEGTSVATFSITTNPVSSDTAVSISAMAEDTASRTATLTVKAPVPTSFSFSPASVVGGSSSIATVNLSGLAPAGGIEITLSSPDSAVAVPATIVIAEGQNTTTFTATTTPVPANHVVGVSASRGTVTRTANLTVRAPAPTSFSLTPSVVIGGSSSSATLTLTGPAPEGGIEVTLSSANVAAVLPPSVSVPPSATSITFNVGTTAVATQTSGSVSATYAGVTRSDSLTITVPVTSAVSLNPAQVGGGGTLTGIVTLTGPAPSGGVVVQLTSSKTTVANVPATVNVEAGESTAAFVVTTNAVTASQSVTISATLNGVKKSATLSVVPLALSGIGADPASIRVNDSTFITVALNGPAPSAGFAVSLSSSNSTVVNVPASVMIPGGTSSITITVSANAPGITNVTASANAVSYVAVLTVSP